MKVAIIIPSYYPEIGGAEVFAQEVAEYLVKKGDKADIITTRSDGSLGEVETINGVVVQRIIMGRIKYLSYISGYFRLLWRTLRLDRAKNYDIIHAVGDGLPSILAATIKKLRGKLHLITIQGGDIAPGYKKNLSGRIAKKLQQWSFRNADAVHVISRKLCQQVEHLSAHNAVIIPNGVDAGIFRPMNKAELRKRHGFSQDEKIIIGVARLIPRKGIDYLIKATALVSEHLPNVRLIIIGDGIQRVELEKFTKGLKINDKARILGFVPHNQIPQYLNIADVFVIPSLYEPLGIVTIEAMACGVPVIGTDVDGIPDIIEDGKNGILVPVGDVKALSDAIEKLLQNKNLKEKFVKEGLKKVKKRFLWDSILSQIEEIYTNLAQNKKDRKQGNESNIGN